MDYCLVDRPLVFRFCLLKRIICETGKDVTIMLDTNQRVPGSTLPINEAWLEQTGLRYTIVPIPANAQSFFGVNLNMLTIRKAKQTEQRMIIELGGGVFSEEILKMLENYDISLGFGRKKSFEEICRSYCAVNESILFDQTYFESGLYDSVVCMRTRSTLGLNEHLEAVKNEMGL